MAGLTSILSTRVGLPLSVFTSPPVRGAQMILGFCYTHTPTPAPTSRFLERQNYNIPGGHHKLNQSQDRAVRSALQKQFTVIQGPPGGAHLQEPGGAALHRQMWP